MTIIELSAGHRLGLTSKGNRFLSLVAIKQLPLTVQGNRVTAWRPKGINCFGLVTAHGWRQGLWALCGRKSPPPCQSAEGLRCLYKLLGHRGPIRPAIVASDDGGGSIMETEMEDRSLIL